MRYASLLLSITAACSSYFEAPAPAPPQCTLPPDASPSDGGSPSDASPSFVTVTFDLPAAPTAPLTGDLIVRGHLTALSGVTVSKVFVAGFPATHDGADFSAFDVTVPIAVIQAEAASAGSPNLAKLDIAVISNCAPGPTVIQQLSVPLRAIADLMLTLEAPEHGYVPSSINRPAIFDLDANPEAAGLPLALSASQGTVTGPTVLPGDGVTRVAAKLYLVPDSTKQGLAEVTVQSGPVARTSSVAVVGPPTLNPATASISRGGSELEVFVNNALPAEQLAASIAGCTAGVTSGIAVHVGPDDISGQGLTPLTATDGAHHPIFRVAALPTAAAMSTISVTCFDAYGQSATGTYTAN